MLYQAVIENRGEIFAEESNIRLDYCVKHSGDLLRGMTNLHHSGNSEIIGFIVSAIFVSLSALLLVWKAISTGSLPLQTARLVLSKRPETTIAMCDPAGLQVIVDFFALYFVFAFQACCSRK